MTCAMCGGQGFVYRADIVDGRAIWSEPHEVPETVQCPLCFLNHLIGA